MRLIALTCVSLVVAGCAAASVAPSAPRPRSTGPGSTGPGSTGPGSTATTVSAAPSGTAAGSASSAKPSASGSTGAGPAPAGAGATATGQACASPATSASVGAGTLSGVQFVSATQGWTVGQDTILATSDGGAHWRPQLTGKLNLTSVDFVSPTDGWAVGTASLLTTTDGGAHWTALPEPCPLIRSVHFISPTAGFAVAGGDNGEPDVGVIPYRDGTVLATSDGGHTWHAMATPADAQTVCFSDASDGWLGADGHLYRTSDGGRGWTAVGTKRSAVTSGAQVMEVQCAGPGAAWAMALGPGAGMNQEPHAGYHADAAGATPIFAEQYFQNPGGAPKAESPGSIAGPFSALSASSAVFVDWCSACGYGTAPWDVASGSGSVLTREGNVGDIASPEAASFLSAQVGWVAGIYATYPASGKSRQQQRIVATTDGGKTWHIQYARPWSAN